MTDRFVKEGNVYEDRFELYRKKPVIVGAYQTEEEVVLDTLEGDMKANEGDWIIKGVKGELYPCKPDVFEMTYEKAYVPEDEDGS